MMRTSVAALLPGVRATRRNEAESEGALRSYWLITEVAGRGVVIGSA